MEKGNQDTLTAICMLINYVFMVPITTKTTKDVINAYVNHVYSTFGQSKDVLSDRDEKFTSKQFTWLAKELLFTKVYTSLYTPAGNSVIKRTCSFLKASLRKIICNHNTELDNIGHKATMADNVFLHSSTGEAPFHLIIR